MGWRRGETPGPPLVGESGMVGQRTPQPNLPVRTINEEESDFAFGFPAGHDGPWLQRREEGFDRGLDGHFRRRMGEPARERCH